MRNPARVALEGVVYHGTPRRDAALGILRDGIQLERRPEYHSSGALDPVSGMVYVTPSIEYATIYALGGPFMGYKMSPVREGGERYGYVFVIPAEELRMVQPDEDSIGGMVTEGSPEWLVELADELLTGVYTQYPEDYDEDSGYYLRHLVDDGLYAAQAEAGRIIAPRLTDDEIVELIRLGAHIAHEGPLFPSECWRIDKRRSQELLPDASNFFDIAEPCE